MGRSRECVQVSVLTHAHTFRLCELPPHYCEYPHTHIHTHTHTHIRAPVPLSYAAAASLSYARAHI